MKTVIWTNTLSAAVLNTREQTACAPGGSFLCNLTKSNFMRVEQLSWHFCRNLQPTSISSQKHSYHCTALQPHQPPLLKATVMAQAVAGRQLGQVPQVLGEELRGAVFLALVCVIVTQLRTSNPFSLEECWGGRGLCLAWADFKLLGQGLAHVWTWRVPYTKQPSNLLTAWNMLHQSR